jgi:hypothetical protein
MRTQSSDMVTLLRSRDCSESEGTVLIVHAVPVRSKVSETSPQGGPHTRFRSLRLISITRCARP